MNENTDMDTQELVSQLRRELAIAAKSGINFILAACVVWLVVTYLWTLPYSAYNRSVLTFIAASLLLPLAWVFSKILGTAWSVPGNALEPLGLWLNFAQLCYFPFLVFVLLRYPEDFVMTLAIITGAHLFPYAWFYDTRVYAIAGVGIPVGSLLLGLTLEAREVFWIPLFVAVSMAMLAAALFLSFRRKASGQERAG